MYIYIICGWKMITWTGHWKPCPYNNVQGKSNNIMTRLIGISITAK